MSETLTTTRIYVKDRDVLLSRFGGPLHESIRKAIQANCPHPENKRSYMTADLPLPGASQERHTLGGFYCHECGRYIFQAPIAR